MDDAPDKPRQFKELIDHGRPQEALVFFLSRIQSKSWQQLSTSELSMLDLLCQHVLDHLLESHTLWLVKHPDRLRRMLQLLTEALKVKYRPAATVDQIAWLRCLLAINQALAGHIQTVHRELCLAADGARIGSVPGPNGIFQERVKSIELTERTGTEFLKEFFASYMEFLKRAGQYELANYLDSRMGKLLSHIARDESRPGVVQALFYDKISSTGYCGFVHVSVQRLSNDDAKGPIQYARENQHVIDPAMRQAAGYARDAVDCYLKRTGYPDGLDERIVRWEIATLEGEPVKLRQRFQGGSVALPLAVAIISQYLARPVANDTAFTGALTEATVAVGYIQPVDGVPEKIRHAVGTGARLVYVPEANAKRLGSEPSLLNLAKEHDARIIPADSLEAVCSWLFPPEGSGKLADTLKDTLANAIWVLNPLESKTKQASTKDCHERYRFHVITCSILTAALVFLEGWKLYYAFAPSYPALAAWTRIGISTIVVFAGMIVCFCLPGACLLHRRAWSLYASAAVVMLALLAGTILIGGMMPDFVKISNIAPPVAGLLKDMFVIWIFAWAIAANTFHVVAALEDLVSRRQFVTAQSCLRWDSPLETRMRIHCIYFPWKWGAVCIAVVAAFLLVLDLNYYSTIDTVTGAGYWEITLGLSRDILFIGVIAEVMVFYKTALAGIRKALS